MLPRPEPSAGIAAYDKELAARLSLDERCRDNYKRYLVSRRSASPNYLPVKLDIEGVSRCNFACTMCAVAKWKKGTRAADMSLECFERLIEEQYGLVEIKLNGLGEPLMAGEVLFQMIRYARAKRIWVRITTNASLLHLKDNYRKLVNSGVNEIDISIDGADKATFEGIRIQSDWKQVVENCTRLNVYCESLGIVRTKMWTLVQRSNYTRLLGHVRIAKEMGFRNMVFSLQLHGWGDDALAARNAGEMVTLDEGYLQTLISAGDEFGVRVAFWNVADKFDAENMCPWPFERAVVTSDSRTVPCCMIGDPDKFEIARGSTFLQAWKSDEYRDFRLAHIKGKVPSVCKACYR